MCDEAIDKLIKEDTPYIDLTTLVLDINNEKGKITFISREDGVLACSEEVVRIFDKLNITTKQFLPTGSIIQKGEPLIVGEGNVGNLHMAWKVCLNILEYCCGMATRTKRLVDKAQKENEKISIVTTRKIFPGTKELAIKSILAGGAYPHRLGLSETILIFEQHLNFYGGIDNVVKNMIDIKRKACEKKVIVEVETLEDAIKLARVGVDGLQFDKLSPTELKECVKEVRSINESITLVGAGGINESNVAEYASTGIDAVATTCLYFGKPLDMTAKIDRV
ncbi:pyrophosphorylase ModD [Gottschalkia acidurici 9a]|uniref:Putative pyrophosphorylase ModD n=1 Tax=Gottschalkia acidurici (strain ATCC 7906 / DSM 604 / BCRC 14475 / CIP 104303 / KCTC 5404 / NCIMB 10678 / 9a) TaxID=1128398 RepID=K0B0W1_GOTA9|nr:ModD protein [Gottschalkia acidurici]AFS79154.1 pyrophosphorylase ModD [Gottschalkia acidurici 9a]